MMTPEFACMPVESVTDPTEAETEATLLAGMIADEPRAWRDFNDRYSRLIYRCITRVTARFSAVVGPDDVREIYAMLCVQLLANDKRKLRSFEPGRGNKLGSWIGMLAIHSAYDHLRTLKREPKRGTLSEAEGLSSELPDPHDVCVFRQQVGMVSEILAEFSDKDREFITLYFGESLEPEEIAVRMGISVKTVYSKKHKIRSRLETLLVQRRLAA
ncbi:MAG: sigma-70 family RNA polymerase sigma factor [Myxococcales bacterium]|nr:sigma-70 family RNA polymerase sigma factor [Myxococcales bacterium]